MLHAVAAQLTRRVLWAYMGTLLTADARRCLDREKDQTFVERVLPWDTSEAAVSSNRKFAAASGRCNFQISRSKPHLASRYVRVAIDRSLEQQCLAVVTKTHSRHSPYSSAQPKTFI